jgi:ABC-type sugar transport system ATPase subunit
MPASVAPTAAPVLEMRGISKSFPGVQALRDVSLDLRGGEALALVGENGAGKSTLIRVLGGANVPDTGTIRVDGGEIAIRSPQDAQRAGIAIIYQEFNLVPFLSARENIFLGRETTRFGFVRRSSERERAQELFARLGVDIDPEMPCGRLSVAHQQAVEIAKALAFDARIIVMDEPTAALARHEVDTLLKLVATLAAQGIGIIYVSHRLEEIFRACDRIMVMRDGAHVGTRATSELDRQQLIEMMVGRKLENEFPARNVSAGETRLAVGDLSRGHKVRAVSFDVRRGSAPDGRKHCGSFSGPTLATPGKSPSTAGCSPSQARATRSPPASVCLPKIESRRGWSWACRSSRISGCQT